MSTCTPLAAHVGPCEPGHWEYQLGHHDNSQTGSHKGGVNVVPEVVLYSSSSSSVPDGPLNTLLVVGGACPSVGKHILRTVPYQAWGGHCIHVCSQQCLLTCEELDFTL